jgi:hypothetical protein
MAEALRRPAPLPQDEAPEAPRPQIAPAAPLKKRIAATEKLLRVKRRERARWLL